jgi:Family of unknown function (DUF6062)
MTASSDRDDSGKLNAGGNVDHAAFNMLEALRQPGTGCPVCHLVQKGVVSYLDGISYESVNDLDIRHELRKSLGYCAAHGQEWLRLRDTLGTAMIYRDVLTYVLEIMQARVAPAKLAEGDAEILENGEDRVEGAGENGLMAKLQGFFGNGQTGSSPGRTLAAELEPSAPCPVCRYALKKEKDMTDSFAGALAHDDFLEAYRRHETGLCLPHFRQVLRGISQASLVRVLVRAQEAKLASTLADLSEVVRKYDYRNMGEAHGDEFKVPARSVEQAAGSLSTQLNLPGH